jgi:sec-independent protein translocase protein TatC
VSDDNNDHEIESSRAPLMEHLVELRQRLIVSIAALLVGFLVCFFFAKNIFIVLVHPFEMATALVAVQKGAGHGYFDMLLTLLGIKPMPVTANTGMVFTAPLEFFFTQVKLAGFGGLVVAFPVIGWQIYRFVAPGLYKRERMAFLPFLLASPVLFAMGAALVYFIMLPFVLWFGLSQQITGVGKVSVQMLPKVSDYLDLVTALLLAFGLCFQLPVVLSLLGMAGIISSATLRSVRRYAIVGVCALAAVVTPPDPISMLSLAVPLVLLYEVSIWCVKLIEVRRTKDEAAEEAS